MKCLPRILALLCYEHPQVNNMERGEKEGRESWGRGWCYIHPNLGFRDLIQDIILDIHPGQPSSVFFHSQHLITLEALPGQTCPANLQGLWDYPHVTDPATLRSVVTEKWITRSEWYSLDSKEHNLNWKFLVELLLYVETWMRYKLQ